MPTSPHPPVDPAALPPLIAAYIQATNSCDIERLLATFAEDAREDQATLACQNCRRHWRTMNDGNSSALAIKLLDTAAGVIQYDPAAAMICIAHATGLLRADLGASDHHPNGATGRVVPGGLAPWQICRVTAHIDTAIGSAIRLRDCAKIAQLSTSYFARAFRISFGETFSRHVLICRTERAQQMMLHTNDSLSQISLACGFADQAHFSRVFRSRVGQSPAVWRRQRDAGPLSTG
jgi:AraC family transcriptional regulator